MKYIFLLFMTMIYLAYSNEDGNKLVKAEIVYYNSAPQKGNNRIGILLNIENGWHTYWKNPGDAGMATKVTWDIPEDFVISDAILPYPDKMPFGDMANYGYEDEVLMIYNLYIPDDYDDEHIEINAMVSWLVCREKCLPGSAELNSKSTLSDENNSFSIYALLFEKYLDMVPAENILDGKSYYSQEYENKVKLFIDNLPQYEKVEFFPYENGYFAAAPEQNYNYKNNTTELTLTLDNYRIDEPDKIYGIIKAEKNEKSIAYEINVPIIKESSDESNR